jgi:hypothetical protein
VDGKGLSFGGGNPTLVVERNLIYKRFGITDKIAPEEAKLASQYRYNAIKYLDGFLDVQLKKTRE